MCFRASHSHQTPKRLVDGIQTSGDYFAIGVGGAVTGKGADVLIIDDPIRNKKRHWGLTPRSLRQGLRMVHIRPATASATGRCHNYRDDPLVCKRPDGANYQVCHPKRGRGRVGSHRTARDYAIWRPIVA